MVIQQHVIDPIQEVKEYTGYCKVNPSKLYVMPEIKLCVREKVVSYVCYAIHLQINLFHWKLF